MRTNEDDKLDRLFAAARSERIDTTAAEEYFETRLLARIREERDVRVPWYALAWRSIPAFVMVTVVLAVGSITYDRSTSTDLFASISSGQEESLTKSILSEE